MHNILIIGAHQLSRRHLQGVLLNENESKTTIVDTSHESLNIACQRALEVKYGNPNSTVSYKIDIPINESIGIDNIYDFKTAELYFDLNRREL
jgi:hypothetical protein